MQGNCAEFAKYVGPVRHDLQNLDNVSPVRHDLQNLDNMSVLSDMTSKIWTTCQSCRTWPAKFGQYVSSVRHDQQNLDNMSVLSDMTCKIWTMSVLSDMTCKIWTICQSCQTWPAKFGQYVSPVRHDQQNLDNVSSVRHDQQNLDNMSVLSDMTSKIWTMSVLSDMTCKIWGDHMGRFDCISILSNHITLYIGYSVIIRVVFF
jgi:hypothetical protein